MSLRRYMEIVENAHTEGQIKAIVAEYGDVSDTTWSYDPDFSLDEVPETGERAAWYDQTYGRQPPPNRDPVILFYGYDGNVHVWDGSHRIGWAVLQGEVTVPAYVGRHAA